MYIPNKFSNSLAAIKSIGMYANQQGWHALIGDIISIIRSEVLNLAPYPEFSEKLANKHLLMIGGARTSLALRRAKQLGISLTIVDEMRMEQFVANEVKPWPAFDRNMNSSLKRSSAVVWQQVKQFIGIQDFGRVGVKRPEEVLDAIRGQCLSGRTADVPQEHALFDGIFTLVEDHGPLTSFLAERLGLLASSSKSAKLARNKFLMRKAMQEASLHVPRFAQITSESDVPAAAAAVGFPAFLKPVYGVQVSTP
jgi:hypothetical protein